MGLERFHRSKDSCLDGAHRNAEYFRDLGVGQAVVPGENESLALLFGQGRESGADRVPPLPKNQSALDAAAAAAAIGRLRNGFEGDDRRPAFAAIAKSHDATSARPSYWWAREITFTKTSCVTSSADALSERSRSVNRRSAGA